MYMFIVFIIGTAGSGKSLLTASFSDWLKLAKQNVITINLDPGVLTLPYTPDIDIRDYVKIEQLMQQYGLGPNGAVVMAADLIAEETERLGEEIFTFNPDIALIARARSGATGYIKGVQSDNPYAPGLAVSTGTDSIASNIVNYALYPSANVTYVTINLFAVGQPSSVSELYTELYAEPLSLVVMRSIGVAAAYTIAFLFLSWYAFKRAQVLE